MRDQAMQETKFHYQESSRVNENASGDYKAVNTEAAGPYREMEF